MRQPEPCSAKETNVGKLAPAGKKCSDLLRRAHYHVRTFCVTGIDTPLSATGIFRVQKAHRRIQNLPMNSPDQFSIVEALALHFG
ncbi:MAG: hypothetical protein U5N56_04860 [Candidatus Marinimicrobia bacterium]|nr:hypothetical protein [Candidatus Neomarinimicrobiota bacterium]